MTGIEHATPGIIVLLGLLSVIFCWSFYSVRAGRSFEIRKIPGIDAIEDAIGRSAEQGRAISFSTGLTDISPTLYACLGVLEAITKKAAQYKLKLLVPQYSPEVMAVVEDTVRQAYRDVGKGSLFDPSAIKFLSSEQFAFASGYMGLIHREKPGAAFLFGAFAAESLILAEAGQQVGARQVAASVSPEQVAFFICTCEYTLIGEELFGASAYLSRDPVQVATVVAQDRVKLLFCIFILIGVVCATVASWDSTLSWLNPVSLLFLSWGDVVAW
jgi:hypothetical protein